MVDTFQDYMTNNLRQFKIKIYDDLMIHSSHLFLDSDLVNYFTKPIESFDVDQLHLKIQEPR